MGSLATELQQIRKDVNRVMRQEMPIVGASGTVPPPDAVGDTLIATAGPLWGILTTPGAAGYARVSTATTEAWSQTPPWTGRHSFLAGIAMVGASAANDLVVPDDVQKAFELEDSAGLEYLTLDTRNVQPAINFNLGGLDVDLNVQASGVPDAFQVRGADGQITLGALGSGLVKVTAGVLGLAIATDLPAHAAEHEVGGGDLVDHNLLTNFSANEHIDHTAVTLTAGAGLTGGGDISANRTFTLGTPSTSTVSTLNAVTAISHVHAVSSSSAPGAGSALLKSDINGRLQLEGLSLRAALANADALYVPWILGDTKTTAYFGSTNVGNNQTAVTAITSSAIALSATAAGNIAVKGVSTSSVGAQGESTSNAGVKGISSSSVGVQGESTSGVGVFGDSASNFGGFFRSATGTGLEVNLTGAGIIANFEDNGTSVLTIQDGGQADFARYIRHLGDTNTFWQFQPDQASLDCGGVTMINAVETAKNYIDFPVGYARINTPATNDFMTVGLEIDQKGADDEGLALRDSTDVGHGMTALTETDTYGVLAKANAAEGGLIVTGYRAADASNALALRGRLGVAADTTKSTAAIGVVSVIAQVKSGTGATSVGADGNLMTIRNSGTTRFIFDAEGTGHADVSWITFSDRRLKQNVEPLKYGLREVLALEPVSYNRKESGRAMVGLIAQDVDQWIPEATRKPPNVASFWSLDYNALVPVLVRAVQELKAEIEELKQ